MTSRAPDNSILEQIAQLQRDVERLQTVARIPGLTVLDAAQGGLGYSGFTDNTDYAITTTNAWTDPAAGVLTTVDVTIARSGRALVIYGSEVRLTNGTGAGSRIHGTVAVTGATTIAAPVPGFTPIFTNPVASTQQIGFINDFKLVRGLTPGVNTFTPKYFFAPGTGAPTLSLLNPYIIAIPL